MEFTMRERSEPSFIQFKPGTVVKGVLITIEKTVVQDKVAVRYTVKNGASRSWLAIYLRILSTRHGGVLAI